MDQVPALMPLVTRPKKDARECVQFFTSLGLGPLVLCRFLLLGERHFTLLLSPSNEVFSLSRPATRE
jgi:hypothetical protein